jgi:NAD(P)-dependent dehydrogenase (short-subunit alcohol dehydrogenase family)
MMQKSGRVAVVTGATSGIGKALALALAKRGDLVVGLGRNPDRLAQLQSALGADHHVLSLDVASEIDMIRLADHLAQIGRVDLLIACAVLGRAGGENTLPLRARDLPLADWQAMLDVNLHGVFLANHAVLPLMRAAQDGNIVNIRLDRLWPRTGG